MERNREIFIAKTNFKYRQGQAGNIINPTRLRIDIVCVNILSYGMY